MVSRYSNVDGSAFTLPIRPRMGEIDDFLMTGMLQGHVELQERQLMARSMVG